VFAPYAKETTNEGQSMPRGTKVRIVWDEITPYPSKLEEIKLGNKIHDAPHELGLAS
jgi:hypothetical protein